MPNRQRQLAHWLTESCGLHPLAVTPASEDASFRRYFRVRLADGESRIAMDAPPDKEDCAPFLAVAERMAAAGLHVPQVFAADLAQGFLLLEDLGSLAYLDALDADSAGRLYRDALDALLRLQSAAPIAGLARYDEALLRREMQLFPDWLLDTHLGLTLAPAERTMLADAFDNLVENALAQPLVCVHRDYHSRNLMVVGAHNPGVIDFQDAVAGPVTYDLVSLLRDCYVRWPAQRVDAWVGDWYRRARPAGLTADADLATVLAWFDLMGVQRHLKAAGIFARLHHRDGKSGYLADIPRTLGYIVEVGERRAPLARLGAFVAERVLAGL